MTIEDREKIWLEFLNEKDNKRMGRFDKESYTKWLEEEIFKHRNRESEVKNDN